MDLREEQAPLERGEEGDGEVVRVDLADEMPGGVKVSQAVADGG